MPSAAQQPEDDIPFDPTPPQGINIPAELIYERGSDRLDQFLETNPLGAKRELVTLAGPVEWTPPAPFFNDAAGSAIQNLRDHLMQISIRCQMAEAQLNAVSHASEGLLSILVKIAEKYSQQFSSEDRAELLALIQEITQALPPG